jgi:ribonuclease-3
MSRAERPLAGAPVEVFRSHSSIEAEVVRGLLTAHDIDAFVGSALALSVFPMRFDQTEFSVSVPNVAAKRARDLIASHLDEAAASEVRRIKETLGPLEKRIGYAFRDLGLLEHALTHKSRTAEDPSGGVADNESLEFLGDAVLGFITADLLFRECPEYSEGPKSKAKAALVSTTALAGLSRQLGLGNDLLLGRGEEKTGGRAKPALLADAFEAVIAAIYLDGGVEAARAFIERQLRPLLSDVRRSSTFGRDHKSSLQEILQGRGRSLPLYRVSSESGPDHQKHFHVDVVVDGRVLASGDGRTKKDAEQEAARLALESLPSQPGGAATGD